MSRKQMSYIDKLNFIQAITKGTQKELAAKLNVTPKTISEWLHSRKVPSVANEKNITKLYRNTLTIAEQKSEATKKLHEFESKVFAIAKPKNDLTEKEYYKAKAYAIFLDKTNNSKIYLFPGLGGEPDEWYMALGHSMIFYKIIIAPRLGRKAHILKDSDDEYVQKEGVVSVKWGNTIIEDTKQLGYSATKIKFNIIAIDLGKEYTEKEIGQMRSAVIAEKNKVKTIIKPKQVYPKIINAINTLAGTLPSKIRKLHPSVRNYYAGKLNDPIVEMIELYYHMANGHIEKRDAKQGMLEATDKFAAILHLMDEGGQLTITARMRMGQSLVKIIESIEEIL